MTRFRPAVPEHQPLIRAGVHDTHQPELFVEGTQELLTAAASPARTGRRGNPTVT